MEKIQCTEFYHYRFLSRLTMKDSGKLLACTVTRCDEKNNNYKNSIYLTRNGKFEKLTGLDKESSFIFLDENTLLFSALRDPDEIKKVQEGYPLTSFYRLPLYGGEAIKAFTLPLKVTSYVKLSDTRLVIRAAVDVEYADYYRYDDEKKKAVLLAKKENADYEVIDEIPWWSNGGGFTNKMRNRLFIYDMETDELTPLTDPLFNTGSISVCESEHKVLFTGSAYERKPIRKGFLYCYDDDTKKTEMILDGTMFKMIRDPYYYDGKIIFAANTGKRHGNNENPYFYTVDILNKEVKLLSEWEDSVGSSVGSDCRYGSGEVTRFVDGKVYFLSTIRNASCLYCLDLDGHIEKLTDFEGSIDMFDTDGKTVYFVGMLNNKLQEVYRYDLKTKDLQQISSFNEDVLKGKYVASTNKMTIQSHGRDIDGWVLLPKDYDPTKKYPAILDIHGGPKTVYGEVFVHEMQYWANEGYFVFFCNPVGSDGRGNQFADIRGKYGTEDYDNLMDFTTEVLKAYPAIDQNKVAVTGGSYGGFMTNWIIGHTDRFCAAASQRSISNWMSMYGTCDIGFFFAPDQMDADPFTDEGQSKMWWHSPLRYASNVKTPTLFIHSNEDYRCWIPEGMQMYTAITDLGVEARMCYFKGENHELSRSGKPLHRTRRLKEITDWFDAHCK